MDNYACKLFSSSTFDATVLGQDSQTKDSNKARQRGRWSVCEALQPLLFPLHSQEARFQFQLIPNQTGSSKHDLIWPLHIGMH